MGGKQIKRTRKEAQENLLEQIRLLENKCILFDAGETVEALDIATKLRVLLHDTGNSTSLLKVLCIKVELISFYLIMIVVML